MCGSYESFDDIVSDPAETEVRDVASDTDTDTDWTDAPALDLTVLTPNFSGDEDPEWVAELLAGKVTVAPGGDGPSYVIQHRIEGEDGPEGTWHQEFAFPMEEVRDEFYDFLTAPENAGIRPDNFRYQKEDTVLSNTDRTAVLAGLRVIADVTVDVDVN